MKTWLSLKQAEQYALLQLFGMSMLLGFAMSGVMILVNNVMHVDDSALRSAGGVIGFVLVMAIFSLNRKFIARYSAVLTDQITARRIEVAERLRGSELRVLEGLPEIETQLAQEFSHLDDLPSLVVPIGFIMANALLSSMYVAVISWWGLCVWLVIILGLVYIQQQARLKMKQAAPALARAQAVFARVLRLRLEGFAQLRFDSKVRDACRAELFALEQRCSDAQANLNGALGGSMAWGEDALVLGLGMVLFWLPSATDMSSDTLYKVATMILSVSGMTLAGIALSFRIQIIHAAFLRLQTLETVLGLPAVLHPLPPVLAPGASLRLTLDQGCFSYASDGFQVGPVDLKVRGGELVIIRGGNGSGKTTLMRMLAGLYPITKGMLCLGDRKIKEGDMEWYRAHITAIFTGQYLFDQLYGLEASEEEVQGLLARFGLSHVTALQNHRFTHLSLSSGQSKRLAMIIALLERRPIVLLDEWDSHQDPGIRSFYYEELLPELKAQGKIVIVISHDARRFHLADHLLHLKDGKMWVDESVS